MSKNSFKDLEDLYVQERGDASSETKRKVNANINLFSFVSNLIELYIPKVGSVLQSFDRANATQDKKIKKYPNK